jgi:hypothetical protein
MWLMFVSIAYALRSIEEQDSATVQEDSQKLQAAVDVLDAFCYQYNNNEVRDDTAARRAARKYCENASR